MWELAWLVVPVWGSEWALGWVVLEWELVWWAVLEWELVWLVVPGWELAWTVVK